MNDKVCLVTGATNGIGLETARALAGTGATVLVHGRDLARARAVAQELARSTANPRVRAVQADFARLADVRQLAAELNASLPRLDVLVNNAGMMSARRAASAEGYDLTFAVNHLAPFLLTNLLLPRLTAAGGARIVVVASAAHRRARLDFDDLMNAKVSGLLPAYARSKLANILFTRSLAQRLRAAAVTANALHPGFVSSHIFHATPALRFVLMPLAPLLMRTPAQGAATSIYLATAPQVAGISGAYYERGQQVAPSEAAQNAADGERLWQESARLTGLPPNA
jgi:NAD(P)-dependent dehydrogenase (short-subunit alcohol dehydrogenase family)